MDNLIKQVAEWTKKVGYEDDVFCEEQVKKIKEEFDEVLNEVSAEIEQMIFNPLKPSNIHLEFGQLLHTVLVLGVQLGLDPKECLALALKENVGRKYELKGNTLVRVE